MPTSGFLAFVPPNHAATSLPAAVSTIVEVWNSGYVAPGLMSAVCTTTRPSAWPMATDHKIPSPAFPVATGPLVNNATTTSKVVLRKSAAVG